ncbi:MAG: flavodoxin family protein, partial [Methanoregula sp.]|nr:flavodoxin family protein [Methanoregula sp.]
MPAPIVGRRFGVGLTPQLAAGKVKGIRVLGISGSSRQEPGLSKSERLLLRALERCSTLGCETTFIRLKDLRIYECEGNY